MSTANFLNEDFGSDESEGEDFNPAQHVSSDEENDRKPASGPSRSRSRSRKGSSGPTKKKKQPLSQATIDDSDDEDDDEVKDGDGDGKDAVEDDGEDVNDEVDDEEDEEDEDEEEEEDRPRKRRRRPGHLQFIDEEAEVDDEDEDEENEDEDLVDETHPDDAADLPVGVENDDYRHRELDRQRERLREQDMETEAKRLREKYGRTKTSMAQTTGIPQHLLLPSVDDPTIWGVRCKPGKEYEVVNMIMKRYADAQFTPNPLHISGAFARPSAMQGYVYIEARKQAEVTKATIDMTFAYSSQMTLIPQNEMPDLLRVKKQKTIKHGDFVRIKRPLKYAGDLALVELVEENQSEATVKLVPRIDYTVNDDPNGQKRKRPIGTRPPPKLFFDADARKLSNNRMLLTRGKNNFTYLSDEYADGFLIKTLKFSAIDTENVNPSLEEASVFATEGRGEDGVQTQEIDLGKIAALMREAGGEYLAGDAVVIFSGEQQGVKGKVAGIQADVVTIAVSEGPLKGKRIEAPAKSIRKLFDVGDNVKVLQNSKYRGESGTVLKVSDEKVTLLTDSTRQEIVVLSRDLRVALDSSGPRIASKYALFDLLQLDASTVGCVVRVDPETLQILDQNGTVRTMFPSNISGKIDTKRPTVATDRSGSEVRKGDSVQETAGASRKGVVMHIYRNFLFLEDKMMMENNGIFVVKSSSIGVVSAKASRESAGPNLTEMNPAFMNRNQHGGMAPPGKPGAPASKPMTIRNRLDGQTCMVARGQQKGLQGRIKSATNSHARVEFMNKPGIHVFELSLLKVKQRNGEWQRLDGTPPNKNPGSRVPVGARVPAGVNSGNRSAWGEFGASANGSSTPFWKSGGDGGRTPAYGGGSGGRTSAWEGSRTVNPYAANDGNRTAYGVRYLSMI
jgi:transcription elongation factor SPT5